MELTIWGVLDVKALVGAFNQEKALVGVFSIITNLRMDDGPSFQALMRALSVIGGGGSNCLCNVPKRFCHLRQVLMDKT